jgi:hypothetical protein
MADTLLGVLALVLAFVLLLLFKPKAFKKIVRRLNKKLK